MNRIEETLKHLHKDHLPKEARLRMREELSSYADLHAASAHTASPLSHAFRFPRMFRMYASLAAVVVIIAGLGGTAYASESALPGDALYSVKTKIAEPIQTALIPSQKGKAAWHALLAERRLEEATQLASTDRLSPAAQQELAANFDVQVQASIESADRLERSGDTTGSLDVRSDLEARLTAHEQILDIVAAHLAENTSTSTNAVGTDEGIKNLLAIVHEHRNVLVGSRIALEDSIAPKISKEAPSHPHTSSTPSIAIAKVAEVRARFEQTTAARVAGADASRNEEVQNILSRHATMLAKFFPVATSTNATTTVASTTATTTIKTLIKDEDE